LGTVQGASLDDEDGLYVGGMFQGVMNLDGEQIGASPMSGSSFYLLKISPGGELDWVKTGYGSSGAIGLDWTVNGLFFMLAVTDSVTYNGVTYHHSAPTTPSTRDFLLFVVSEDGDEVWQNMLTGSRNEQVHHVASSVDAILIQGRFEMDITYDAQTLTGSTVGRLFQVALSSENGARLWMKSQSNEGTAVQSYGAEFLDDGTFITGGFYNGSPSTFTFQDETITSSNGLTDGYEMRQNFQTGNLVWLKTLGAAGYSGVLGMDRTNTGVVLTGFFDSPELSYEGVTLVNHNDESEDSFIIVIDRDGKPQCQITGIGTEADDRGAKVIHDSNYLYTLISFADSTAFGDYELEAQGLKDIALWKTCLPCDTLTSIPEATTTKPALHFYPNPATHTVRLTVSGSTFNARSLAVTDMLGNTVMNIRPETSDLELDISGLASGVYTVAAQLQNGEVLRQRLVVGR